MYRLRQMPAGLRDGYFGLEGAKQSGMHTLRGMSAGVRTGGAAQMQVWPVYGQKAKITMVPGNRILVIRLRTLIRADSENAGELSVCEFMRA